MKEAVVRATVAGWLQVEDAASSTGSSSGSDCDSELLVNPNEVYTYIHAYSRTSANGYSE